MNPVSPLPVPYPTKLIQSIGPGPKMNPNNNTTFIYYRRLRGQEQLVTVSLAKISLQRSSSSPLNRAAHWPPRIAQIAGGTRPGGRSNPSPLPKGEDVLGLSCSWLGMEKIPVPGCPWDSLGVSARASYWRWRWRWRYTRVLAEGNVHQRLWSLKG